MKKAFVLISLLLSFSSFAQHLNLDVTLNPAGSFQAESDNIRGTVVKNKDGSFKADKISVLTQSLKTGIDLRDQHLWKYLHSDTSPKVVLTNIEGKNGKAKGTLDINGVKRPIEINYTEEGTNIIGKFSLETSTYKLPNADYMGVGVEKKIEGEVKLPFKSI